MNELEIKFKELIEYLEEHKKEGEQIQKILKEIKEEEIPEEYKRSYRFYSSLSGDSKTLLFKLAKNPNCKKQFIKSNKFESFGSLKNFNSLKYIPKT